MGVYRSMYKQLLNKPSNIWTIDVVDGRIGVWHQGKFYDHSHMSTTAARNVASVLRMTGVEVI